MSKIIKVKLKALTKEEMFPHLAKNQDILKEKNLKEGIFSNFSELSKIEVKLKSSEIEAQPRSKLKRKKYDENDVSCVQENKGNSSSDNPLKMTLRKRIKTESSERVDEPSKEGKEKIFSSDEEEKKPFSCLKCNKCFKYLSGLQAHENTHTHKIKFSCNKCDQCYTQKSHLERHKLSHAKKKVKPFKCSTCNKSFTQNYYLEVHNRIHTGVKPYKCEVCETSFSQKSHLNTHMKIHNEEKKFECDHCKMAFTLLHHLASHIQKIHKD